MDRIKNIISFLKSFLFRKHSKTTNIKDASLYDYGFDQNNLVFLSDNKNTCYSYCLSPLKFYLINNFEKCFNKILREFNDYNIIPKIGIESEFYATKVSNIDIFFKKVSDFSDKNNIYINKIKTENSENQFELEFSPYIDLWKLINDFNLIKEFLLNLSFDVNFKAKPFYYDVGSSLQINISLNDINGNNLFIKNTDGSENRFLLNSIAGLLEKTNEFLDLYIESENCLDRYDIDFNKLHHLSGKVTSPSYICWGINNRTCSIRIPTSKYFYSHHDYINDTLKNRRIEYRVPSSNCDVGLALYSVLYSVLYGIKNELEPIEQTSNDVFFDESSSLKYNVIY